MIDYKFIAIFKNLPTVGKMKSDLITLSLTPDPLKGA